MSFKQSVTPDAIICLDDCKSFKSLKRHLEIKFGMPPAEYRAKWGLPSDYPMVAPNYAGSRSALALSMGLSRKPAAAIEEPPPKAKRAAPQGRRGPDMKAVLLSVLLSLGLAGVIEPSVPVTLAPSIA